MPQLTPARFVAKWEPVKLSERSASHEHFIDLCQLLSQPTPAAHDATGAEYTFEKGVTPTAGASRGAAGERGFADVWWKGKFAWEYKRKGKYRDLKEAYSQLLQYREALENPPLLIVSDIARTEIHTNFTGTAKEVHVVTLDRLADAHSLDLLRRVFTDPSSFKPKQTTEAVTKEVAKSFATIARSLRQFGHDAHTVAHFLMKCMFCCFAEDVELLPKDLFKRLIQRYQRDPAKLTDRLTELFTKMRTGGDFGPEPIAHFNGGLFDDSPALRLTSNDIGVLLIASQCGWGNVEPAIFGTLFERSLDPNTRAQIGAHYTSREDIMLVVEPVVMAPLRREWEAVKADVEAQLDRRRKVTTKKTKGKAEQDVAELLRDFVQRLASVRILDPACGSGNFLYVAIQQLLHLEKEVITYAARPDIAVGLLPQVRPTQLHGIEINPYAAELAQVVIWIGYLQWMRDNGFAALNPILEPLQTIENRDAILDLSDSKHPAPAKWPDADFIIGNPPFLGSKVFRQQGLSDKYVDDMYSAFDLPKSSDLCCYWFELARRAITLTPSIRAGLLATQRIRGGSNREVLARIAAKANIFLGWSDRNWILDGAAVHVSIVGFSGEPTSDSVLNGNPVPRINSDLSSGSEFRSASRLRANADIAFRGLEKGGAFDVEFNVARSLLATPNPSGLQNTRVLRQYYNGSDLNRRERGVWVIDFGHECAMSDAAGFEAPFEYVRAHVAPNRRTNRRQDLREYWWLARSYPKGLSDALEGKSWYWACCNTFKHWVVSRVHVPATTDSCTTAFAREDYYFAGILHSALHELWLRATGAQLREAESGTRYIVATSFETFPFPWPPGKEPGKHPAHRRIAEAAKELNEQRERWLNPPEWIDPIARAVDAADDFADVPTEARALIRHSAIMARAAKDAKLKKRTLTSLYNERPTWLRLLHEQLDRAVLAAYAATDPEGKWSEDWAQVWIDTGAGQPLPPDHQLAEPRKETDQRVLANLLRMNLDRASNR